MNEFFELLSCLYLFVLASWLAICAGSGSLFIPEPPHRVLLFGLGLCCFGAMKAIVRENLSK